MADSENDVAAAAAWLRARYFYVSADFLTDSAGAAALMGVSSKTLFNRRTLGTAPPHAHKTGRRMYYRIAALLPYRDPR